jgi:glycosyltransferase involved in cell wall biosynthesis
LNQGGRSVASLSGPTVSVVMPTYNRVGLLPDTITSILDQDFEDLEFLVVDDGSTDNTAEVIREIQEKEPRLRYLPLPENRGIGYARQTGLEHVSGRYIALADSDDLWLPDKLEVQVELLEKYPEIDILFGDYWDVDYVRGTEASGFAQTQEGMKHLVVRLLADNLWLVEGGVETGLLKSNFIAAPTMLLRTGVFEKVGGFNTKLKTTIDFEFGWRAAVLGAQYAYTNRLLIKRYRYESSVTAQRIGAAKRKLEALKACRRTCEIARRPDLLSHVRTTECRTWRKLIRAYGSNGQRAQVLCAFWESLRYGFSAHTGFHFLLALLGPRAMSFVARVRGPSG